MPERSREESAISKARKFRKEMSLPEVLLWRELRRDPEGFRFRRQVPIGKYTLDFYCAKATLCVEVDGANHEWTEERDASRDAFLLGQGIVTLRVPATEVLTDPAAAAEFVISRCRELS